MNQQTSNGGLQYIPQESKIQYIYLDFDGELTSYNGEILTIDNVVVQNSSLTEERIANIVAELNAKYASSNVIFTTEYPESTEYSTIYIGKTSAFKQYGNFAGLAETVDYENQIPNDNAFVILDASNTDIEIINTISHETDHLLGTLDHGGNGLETYAAKYVSSGVTSSGITLYNDSMYISSGGTANSTTVNSKGIMYIYSGGTANSTTVNSYGYMYVSSGGTATNIIWTPCIGTITVYDGAYVTYTSNYSGVYFGSANKLLSSAQTLDNKVVSGSMYVMNDGTANSTTVYSNGYMYVSSGGTANSTTVYSNGYMYVSSGGTANSTTVYSSGYMYVSSGGTANSTTVNSYGYMYVYSGGTATNIIWTPCIGKVSVYDGAYVTYTSNYSGVYFGSANKLFSSAQTLDNKVVSGSMYVMNDGTANSTTVNSIGIMYIYSGGSANSTTVNSYGGMCIYSGGSANSTTVDYNGYMYVSGTANSTTNRGSMVVYSGGTANGTTVDLSGYMGVSSGGTANGTTVDLSGYMGVNSGGTANSTTVYSSGYMRVNSGGTANSTTIYSSGSMYVWSGGTANSTTVYSSGYMHVYSGGTANSTTVNSSGKLYVYSGGSALEIKENGGYVSIEDGTNVTFASNTINGLTLSFYASMTVHKNTVANNTILDILGDMYIYNGGTANSTTINSRGVMYVHSGGTANSTTVNPDGRMCVYSGGTANSTTVYSSGYMHVYSGGTANSTTVNPDGRMYVDSGGTANSTTVNPDGRMYIYSGGTANSTTVYSNGYMYVRSGGTTNSTTVNPDGRMYVDSGGTANNTTVNSSGYMYVSSGGTATNIIWTPCIGTIAVYDGAYVTYTSNYSGVYFGSANKLFSSAQTLDNKVVCGSMYVMNDGTANSTTVNSKGIMYIYSGGSANSTTVNPWGIMYVSSGGTANSTTVDHNGYMYVRSGGTANSTTNRGSMEVYSGGTANSTTVNPWGIMYVSSGGTANSTTVDHNGRMYVDSGGTANSTTVYSSGYMGVSNGGTANSTTVDSSGKMFVYSGGTANGTTVYSSGYMGVSSGGTANSTTVYSSGSMYVYSGGKHTGSLHLAIGANVSFDRGSIIDFTISDRKSTDDYLINNLSLISGTPTYTITISENQKYGTYKLAQGAEDFSGSITIWDGSITYGVITENGDDFTYNNITYSLDKIGSNLTLTIDQLNKDITPPEIPTFVVSNKEITNEDVIITATFSDDSEHKQYSVNGNAWEDYTKPIVMTNNGIVSFRGIDSAGNISNIATYNVTNIDKILPNKPTATANITSPTNQDVIVTATFSEDSVTEQYSFDNETWVNYTDGIKFTNTGVIYFRGIDAVGNVSKITEYNVSNIDKVAPTIEISGNPQTWTNKDVTLTANVSDGIVEFFDGKNWINGAVQTVANNGTYTFKVTDEAGNVTTKDVVVNFIDNIAPKKPVASANITYLTNQDVIVTATFSEDSVTEQYSLDNKSWNTYTKGITFSKNGVVYFRSIDAAGNISNVAFYEVTNIDKNTPTLEIIGNPTEWTNKNVTLTATINKGVVEFFNGKKWIKGSTHTVTDNGTYQFKATDAAGNVTITEVIVDKIDKVAPTLELSTSNQIDDKTVSVQATINEDDCTIQYKIDNGSWQQYSKNVVVSENCTVNFKVTDKAGNITTKSVTIDSIDNVADNKNIEYIFISSKYTSKTTGKKQNNIVLTYGKNAFSTVESALNKYTDLSNKVIIMVDSKTNINTSINLPTIAGTTVTPTIKETDNSYSYKATSQAKNTITITKDTGNTEFIRFATVDVTGGDVETIIGGKLTNSKETATVVDKKGTVTTTDKFTNTTNATGKFIATHNATIEKVENYSTVNLTNASVNEVTAGNNKETTSSKIVDAYNKYQKTISCVDDKVAAGSITLTDGANANEINAFANVTLNNATAGNISNYTSKDSKSETTTFDDDKNTVTRKVTLNHTENTAGTLKATNVESLGDVTGFATVTLLNVNDAGNFKRVAENGNKYSTVKETLDVKTNKDKTVTGTYSKTETFTRNGKLTATNSNIGNVANYSTVTLDGTTANNISNFQEAKIVTTGTASWKNMDVYSRPNDYDLTLEDFDLIVTTTKSLNGSVTLKNNAKAESITNYQTVTLSNGTVDEISNVNKVSISKGKSIITSYKGTDENDTLSIAKDAVLIANKINLGKEAKDTINLAGTIILTGREFVATNITGKGEIVATSNVYKNLEINFANVLDIGETAENFKGTTFENSDNTLKKAAKWDPANQYDGWMGSWSGTKEGNDEVDFITFKANAGDTLVITNIENSNWTLFDKKGNEIVDVTIFNNNTFLSSGEYILKLENNEDKSISYSVKLA